MTFQDLILKLSAFWASHGCLLQQPLDLEVGAGTSHPETLLRVLGPKPWSVAYVQPSRRPDDGRFGQNPNRLFKHHQYQVILKPSPDEVQQLYLDSLEACGINPRQHDIRFEEDNWESPTLGAWGIGWQVMLDGTGDHAVHLLPAGRRHRPGADLLRDHLRPRAHRDVPAEGRQRVRPRVGRRREVRRGAAAGGDRAVEVRVRPGRRARRRRVRRASIATCSTRTSSSASSCSTSGLILPALEHCLKCSHLFNILDSSGSIGVTERTAYILRVRQLAVTIAQAYVGRRAGSRLAAIEERVAMDRELLIEIGCEEIPAELAARTDARSWRSMLDARLKESRLTTDAPAETYSTPRRLTARVDELAERQTDFEELVTGPPVSAAFKPDGEPTPAAAGFAKKYGVEVSALERSETPKGDVPGVSRAPARQGHGRRAGRCDDRPAARPDVSRSRCAGTPISRTARAIWCSRGRFAGSCSCTADASCRSSSAAPSWRRGRRCRTSGRAPNTYGHRFLTTSGRAGRAIKVKTFDDYEARLLENFVILDRSERESKIRRELETHARRLGGRVSAARGGAVVAAAGSARPRRVSRRSSPATSRWSSSSCRKKC